MENGKIINLMSFKIEPIAGDASFRKFYRLIFKTGTKIAVVSNKEKYKNLNVYSAINNFLTCINHNVKFLLFQYHNHRLY